MKTFVELLKQRRIWAGIFATIALVLSMSGVNVQFDTNSATEAVMQLIEALSGLAAVLLPIWSLVSPKKIKK